MLIRKAFCTLGFLALAAGLLPSHPAMAETTLRIAMTASDVPTTTGHAQQRLRGHALHGLPDLRGAGAVGPHHAPPGGNAACRAWRRSGSRIRADKKTWIFHLRQGVKFHDGTDFNADAVIWNLERYLQQGQRAVRAQRSGIMRGAHAAAGQLQEDRRFDGRDHDHAAGILLPLHGGLHALHLADLVREGRARTGPRSRRCRPAGTGPFKITKVVPRQEADLARWDRLLGSQAQDGEGRQRSS